MQTKRKVERSQSKADATLVMAEKEASGRSLRKRSNRRTLEGNLRVDVLSEVAMKTALQNGLREAYQLRLESGRGPNCSPPSSPAPRSGPEGSSRS